MVVPANLANAIQRSEAGGGAVVVDMVNLVPCVCSWGGRSGVSARVTRLAPGVPHVDASQVVTSAGITTGRSLLYRGVKTTVSR